MAWNCKEQGKTSASAPSRELTTASNPAPCGCLSLGCACQAPSSWALSAPAPTDPWIYPLYGGFTIEASHAGLLLQRACQLGDIESVIAMRGHVSKIEAALHALPVAAHAAQLDVVKELLSWPLPDVCGIVADFIVPMAEGGETEVVNELVAELLSRGDCLPFELEAFFKAVACTGHPGLFWELAEKVDEIVDWGCIMVAAAEFKHWTLAVFAWQRCGEELSIHFSAEQIGKFHWELARQAAALEAAELNQSSTVDVVRAQAQQSRRL